MFFYLDPFFPWHSIEVVDLNRMHTSNKKEMMMIISLTVSQKTVSQKVIMLISLFIFVGILNFVCITWMKMLLAIITSKIQMSCMLELELMT